MCLGAYLPLGMFLPFLFEHMFMKQVVKEEKKETAALENILSLFFFLLNSETKTYYTKHLYRCFLELPTFIVEWAKSTCQYNQEIRADHVLIKG